MSFVAQGLRAGVAPLEPRRWGLMGIVALPLVLTFALVPLYGVVTGTPPGEYSLPIAYLLYGVANVVAAAGLYRLLRPEERAAVFRFRTPSLNELLWVVVAFPVGLGVFLLTDGVLSQFGYTMGGLSYSLSDPATLLAVVLGAVIIAPITEEIFYRGLVLGKLLSHGVGVIPAVAAMAIVFGLLHLPNFGVTGTVFTTLWGLLPAILRLRFDNLTGAVLLHVINNVYAYVVVGFGLY